MSNSNLKFDKTIQFVQDFYQKYDNTINEIDMIFDKIDKNPGHNADQFLKQIFEKLKNFWDSNKRSIDSTITFPNLVALERIEAELCDKSKNFTTEEIRAFGQSIQNEFRNYSALDSKPTVFENSIRIIDSLLDLANSKTYDFYTVKTLYEIISDDLLIRCGISLLYEWNYGTDEYSLLTSEEQLVIVINQAIMFDRLHSGHKMLKRHIDHLNRALNSFSKLDWFVYYVAGFLNFKTHRYCESESFFKEVEKEKEKLFASYDERERKRYFHSVLLIAYGYEYKEKYEKAIEKLSTSIDNIKEILKNYQLSDIDNCLIDILYEIREKSLNNSLFDLYFEKSCKSIIEQINDKNQTDMRKEILHALAHCLNEYAIAEEATTEEVAELDKIIKLARSIMLTLAQNDSEYWTCYATIHGEYKDYDHALLELENAKVKIKESHCGCLPETLSAEIDFFSYYFNSLTYKVADEPSKRFSDYCKKYSDDDAYCHLKIYKFRETLRNYLTMFVDFLAEREDFDERITADDLPDIMDISNDYNEICTLHPSLYMNVNVRADLRIVQRIYAVLKELRKYIILPSISNQYDLLNACKRFDLVKEEIGLPKKDKNVIEETFPYGKFFPKEITASLINIVRCLNSSDTAFILAPISGVIVYQYQTGTIDKLFSISDLKKDVPSHSFDDLNYNDTEISDLVSGYMHRVKNYNKQYINGIDWIQLKRYNIQSVYLWNESLRNKLLLSEPNKCLTWRLINFNEFRSTIGDAISQKDSKKKCTQKETIHYGEKCGLKSVHLPWTEFINETSNPLKCLILYKADIGYIIVKLKSNFNDKQKCKVHTLLSNISFSQINDNIKNNEVDSFDNADISDITKAEISELCKKIYELKNEKIKKEHDKNNYSGEILSEIESLISDIDDQYNKIFSCLQEKMCILKDNVSVAEYENYKALLYNKYDIRL